MKLMITVADIPVWGKFMIVDVKDKTVLHDYDGEGHGDIPFDVATRTVVAMYAKDDEIVMEVCA